MDLTYSLRIMRGGGRPMSAAAIIPSCPEVLVLRHGQTEWNAEGRLQGHLDSPLTEKGLRQAQRQNEILQPYDLTGFMVGQTCLNIAMICPYHSHKQAMC